MCIYILCSISTIAAPIIYTTNETFGPTLNSTFRPIINNTLYTNISTITSSTIENSTNDTEIILIVSGIWICILCCCAMIKCCVDAEQKLDD